MRTGAPTGSPVPGGECFATGVSATISQYRIAYFVRTDLFRGALSALSAPRVGVGIRRLAAALTLGEPCGPAHGRPSSG
jgi:hypothetical protein